MEGNGTDSDESVRISFAIVREPVVVRPGQGRSQRGAIDGLNKKTLRWKENLNINPFQVHVFYPFVRIKTTGSPGCPSFFRIRNSIMDHLIRDQVLAPLFVLDEIRGFVSERRLQVMSPHVGWLKHMTVGVDDPIHD
jgi:hypothetical protein